MSITRKIWALKVHLGLENGTFSADGDLFLPVLFYVAVADCTVDEPAEMSGIEFPGRTGLLNFFGALANVPADILTRVIFLGKQEEELTLHMNGNITPPLFIAAHCFKRGAEQFRELFLGFGQLLPDRGEFVFFHDEPLPLDKLKTVTTYNTL